MRPSEALALHREALVQVIDRYPVVEPRLFGSTARGEDTDGSDLDILVRVAGPMTYFDLFRLEEELAAIAGVKVDVRSEREFSARLLGRLSREIRPL